MNQFFNMKNRIAIVNLIFLATIILNNLASFLPASWFIGRPVLQIVVSQLLLAIPTAYFLIITRAPYCKTVHLHKMKISNALLVILFGFLLQPVLAFVNNLSMVFAVNTTNNFMLELSEQVPWVVAVLLASVLPTLVEETIYRGVFYQTYRSVSPWKAVLMSGFLFGLMHGNLNQFSYAFVMGVIFALLIEATGSILSTMLIHLVLNAWSITQMYLLPKVYEFLQALYRYSLANGDTTSAEYLNASLGDLSLNSSEWLHQLFLNDTVTAQVSLGQVISFSLPSALIFGTLAFLVFRCIAKRSGNWDKIRCDFGGQQDPATIKKWPESETASDTGKEEQGNTIMTVPLMLAIGIGVIAIFVFETLMRLPR